MGKRKIISLLLAMLTAATLSACKDDTPQQEESFEAKPVQGIAAMFNESLGYYNEHASVLEISATERVIYYTKNTTKYEETSDYIAVRKGTKSGNAWTYSEPTVALSPKKDSWNGVHVFQADVVKGNFTYDGVSYNYLMAYAGNNAEGTRKGAQIGLAVAKTAEGPFVQVGAEPFITWTASDYTEFGQNVTQGVCEPSLVNYDGVSSILLFYSLYNPNTVDNCRFLSLNLSGDLKDLGQRKGERGNVLSGKGIMDMGNTSNCVGADFALTEDKTTLVCVRDYYPIAATSPAVSEAVQVISAPIEIMSETVGQDSPSWTILNDKISALDTADWTAEGKPGYDRIYSGSVIASEQGYISTASNFSIVFTSSVVASANVNYRFTPMLHEFMITAEV